MLSLWRAVSVKCVDPGNRASSSSVWRLLLETFACEPRLFILSSLFYVETFKLQECWYESKNRPGIPREQSRLPRRRRSYSATVCFLREEATECRKVALISAKRRQQTRQSSVQANERLVRARSNKCSDNRWHSSHVSRAPLRHTRRSNTCPHLPVHPPSPAPPPRTAPGWSPSHSRWFKDGAAKWTGYVGDWW